MRTYQGIEFSTEKFVQYFHEICCEKDDKFRTTGTDREISGTGRIFSKGLKSWMQGRRF